MSGMELWWLGQSGLRLRDPAGGPVVFVDPFLSPHQDRTWEAPLSPDELGHQADVILCTHQHLDHLDQPTLRADLDAQALVPMHWELFPHNRGSPGDLAAYAAQFHPRLTILTFGRGGRLVYSAACLKD